MASQHYQWTEWQLLWRLLIPAVLCTMWNVLGCAKFYNWLSNLPLLQWTLFSKRPAANLLTAGNIPADIDFIMMVLSGHL